MSMYKFATFPHEPDRQARPVAVTLAKNRTELTSHD